jgi:hypothetical protein
MAPTIGLACASAYLQGLGKETEGGRLAAGFQIMTCRGTLGGGEPQIKLVSDLD